MTHPYFDRAGNAITLERWDQLFRDFAYRKVAETPLSDGGKVSTIWIGVNAALEDEPQIFESLVFNPDGEGWGVELRYATEADALDGHARLTVCAEERLLLECAMSDGGLDAAAVMEEQYIDG